MANIKGSVNVVGKITSKNIAGRVLPDKSLEGNINKNVELVSYNGNETETSVSKVDNISKTISVDVKKVPNSLTIVDSGSGESTVFDGSESKQVNLKNYDEEVASIYEYIDDEIDRATETEEDLRLAIDGEVYIKSVKFWYNFEEIAEKYGIDSDSINHIKFANIGVRFKNLLEPYPTLYDQLSMYYIKIDTTPITQVVLNAITENRCVIRFNYPSRNAKTTPANVNSHAQGTRIYSNDLNPSDSRVAWTKAKHTIIKNNLVFIKQEDVKTTPLGKKYISKIIKVADLLNNSCVNNEQKIIFEDIPQETLRDLSSLKIIKSDNSQKSFEFKEGLPYQFRNQRVESYNNDRLAKTKNSDNPKYQAIRISPSFNRCNELPGIYYITTWAKFMPTVSDNKALYYTIYNRLSYAHNTVARLLGSWSTSEDAHRLLKWYGIAIDGIFDVEGEPTIDSRKSLTRLLLTPSLAILNSDWQTDTGGFSWQISYPLSEQQITMWPAAVYNIDGENYVPLVCKISHFKK